MRTIFVILGLFICSYAFSQKTERAFTEDNAALWGDSIYFTKVDESPWFLGESIEKGFREYLVKNTFYPTAVAENKITGRFIVEFVIEKDGSVSQVKATGDAHSLLMKEALRVISSSPRWAPGKIDGKPVRMHYTLPFHFRLFLNNKEVNPISPGIIKTTKETILLEECVVTCVGTSKG